MNSPRRRARELALKALYQAEMLKAPLDETFNQVLTDAFYQPLFEALGRDFIKNTKIQQILSAEVEDFIFDFADSLAVFPLVPVEELPPKIADLFENYFNGVTKDQQNDKSLQDFYKKIQNRRKKAATSENFARELITRVSENHKHIDQLIEKTAQNWSLERMAVIDRCLLRIAVCEFFYFTEIPVNATINEAIELARKYSAERSYEFINGILDRICKENTLSKCETSAKAKVTDNSKAHIS